MPVSLGCMYVGNSVYQSSMSLSFGLKNTSTS